MIVSPVVTSSVSSPYEANQKLYGPVVANAIGAAEAIGAGASSLVNLSAQGLKRMESQVEAAGEAVAGWANDVEQAVEDLAHTVEDATSQAVDTVRDAGQAVVDGIVDAAEAAGHYLALGAAAAVQSLDELA